MKSDVEFCFLAVINILDLKGARHEIAEMARTNQNEAYISLPAPQAVPGLLIPGPEWNDEIITNSFLIEETEFKLSIKTILE